MRKILSMGIFALLLFISPRPADAWSMPGHRVVASIAWDNMTDRAREFAGKVLSQHPTRKFDLDPARPLEVSVDRYLFISSADWPDLVKSRTSQKSLPKFVKEKYSAWVHRDWHYVKIAMKDPRLFTESEPVLEWKPSEGTTDVFGIDLPNGPGNAIRALHWAVWALAGNNADAPTQAVAMCWLTHLTGDIHQPLHACNIFSKNFPGGDQGGGQIPVKSSEGETNLHSLWDDAVLSHSDDRFNFGRILEAAEHARSERVAVAKSAEGDKARDGQLPTDLGAGFIQWMRDSHALAIKFGHGPLLDKILTLPKDENERDDHPIDLGKFEKYEQNVALWGHARTALAGLRLARIVDRLAGGSGELRSVGEPKADELPVAVGPDGLVFPGNAEAASLRAELAQIRRQLAELTKLVSELKAMREEGAGTGTTK